MSTIPVLDTWERKYFKPAGGDAFLFYAVFGKFQQPLSLSQLQDRSDGAPQQLSVGLHNNWLESAHLQTFVKGYLGEILQEQAFLHQAVVNSPECITLIGTIPDPKDLNYLRDTVGFITSLLRHGGVAVYDPQRLYWWTPADWCRQVFEPNSAVPREHCIILISEEANSSDLKWIHTRGMRKFGRPDISIRAVPNDYSENAIELCNRFIEHQALGSIVPEGQEIKMPGLPQGLKCRHKGYLEDPEFNNVHIEISFAQQ